MTIWSRRPACLVSGLALLLSAADGLAQGSFQNLNFESAIIPSGTQPGAILSFGDAFPGWTGAGYVVYDGMSLGGPLTCIIDRSNVWATLGLNGNIAKPLQGRYSPYLFGGWQPGINGGFVPTATTLSQTGRVPDGAVAILVDVYAWNGFSVSLGGQTLIMMPVQGGPFSSTVYRGDVSAFAGQTAQLSITVPALPYPSIDPNGLLVDDIKFITIPIIQSAGPAMLNPQVTASEFGFTIAGDDGLLVVVEASSNVASPDWSPVGTNVLTGGRSYFSVPQWTNYHTRFYRLRWQ